MSLNLTNLLQGIQNRLNFWTGPSASKQSGVVLLDTASVTWSHDEFGNITATAAGSGASGPANEVLATPNGSSGTATVRALVPADLPVGSASQAGALQVDGTSITATAGVISATAPANVAFTNTANTFTGDQALNSGSGQVFNGSHQWRIFSNPGSQTLYIQDVSNGSYYPLVIHSNDGATAGLEVVSNAGYTFSGGSSGQSADTSIMRPSAGIVQIGDGGSNANGAFQARFITFGVGVQLTAATTITPTNQVHHITGTTVFETITVPANVTIGWQFTIITDVTGVNWGTTGNIGLAGTIAAAGRAVTFTWDGTKFYPNVVA